MGSIPVASAFLHCNTVTPSAGKLAAQGFVIAAPVTPRCMEHDGAGFIHGFSGLSTEVNCATARALPHISHLGVRNTTVPDGNTVFLGYPYLDFAPLRLFLAPGPTEVLEHSDAGSDHGFSGIVTEGIHIWILRHCACFWPQAPPRCKNTPMPDQITASLG